MDLRDVAASLKGGCGAWIADSPPGYSALNGSDRSSRSYSKPAILGLGEFDLGFSCVIILVDLA
jgi:hypothetical protein